INCREQVNQQSQHHGYGKTANRTVPKRVKKQRRNNRRHVSIDDRHKGVTETLLHRRPNRRARAYLFPNALKYEAVRVDSQIVGGLFRESAGNLYLVENLPLDKSDGLYLIIQEHAHVLVNICPGPFAELL